MKPEQIERLRRIAAIESNNPKWSLKIVLSVCLDEIERLQNLMMMASICPRCGNGPETCAASGCGKLAEYESES